VFDVTPGDEFATGIDTDLLGRAYVAGARGLTDAGQDMLLMRLEPDGDLDPTYSGNGWLTLDSLGLSRADMARTVEVQADGRPVFSGHGEGATGNYDFVVVRTTLAGALDSGFSGDGVAQVSFDLGGFYDSVYDLAFDSGSGRLAVVGSADSPSVRRAAVAVLSPAGDLDPTFSGDGKTTFLLEGTDHSNLTSAEWDGLGRLVAAAIVYDGANGPWDFGAVRLQTNGAFDASFGPNGSVVVPFDLAGSGGNDAAWALALQAGRPVLAGDVQHSDDAFRPALVRFQTALIFADGFDTGGVLGWLAWY
jgi:uncharacterized delta-60 repeat protein